MSATPVTPRERFSSELDDSGEYWLLVDHDISVGVNVIAHFWEQAEAQYAVTALNAFPSESDSMIQAELVEALAWALRRIRTSLDIGEHYAKAEAILEKARIEPKPPFKFMDRCPDGQKCGATTTGCLVGSRCQRGIDMDFP